MGHQTPRRSVYVDEEGNPVSPSKQKRLEVEEKSRSLRRARQQRLNSARLERIAQFEQQQLSSREWISFAEIIDWRSRDRGDGSLSEEKKRATLNDLSMEISAGNAFFDENRSQILLTSPLYRVSRTLLSSPWSLREEAWLTKERWGFWHDGPARDQILTCCWIPRAACLRWATNVPFEPKPEWLVHRASVQSPSMAEEADNMHKDEPAPKIAKPKPRGRKPGEGSYRNLDTPLLLKMRQLLSAGNAASAEEAARQVASRAHGGGSPDSKAERLARRFRKEASKKATSE
jgi:hypothetical protein